MLPHKTYRGSLALKRLKLYDGVPVALAKRKKFIVPCALRLIKLAPGRKYSKIGEIFNEIGWNKKKIIEENEEKSKALGKKFWKNKFRLVQQLKKNKRNFNKSTNLKVFAH